MNDMESEGCKMQLVFNLKVCSIQPPLHSLLRRRELVADFLAVAGHILSSWNSLPRLAQAQGGVSSHLQRMASFQKGLTSYQAPPISQS